MKRLLFILGLFSVLIGSAQTISVSSFKLLETDLTANTAGTMEMDQNGETAALIKVVTAQTGFTFDGGSMGIVKTKQTPGEVLVYIPRGAKKISIKHPQLGVLRDYYFPVAIEPAKTYEMVLIAGEVQSVLKQARTSQYVVFQLTPPDAVVEINGEQLQTNDGTATKMLRFGTYNYRVNAPNFLPEAGNIIVNDPQNKHLVNISLKPNFSQVIVTVENNADILINGEYKGSGVWRGNLSSGIYEFETRKQNCSSVSEIREITISAEPLTITLQSPKPILGDAEINSVPALADIFIDGENVGKTPHYISNLQIGRHLLEIKKEGYGVYTSQIDIKEDNTKTIEAELNNLITVSINCNVPSAELYIDGINKGKASGQIQLEVKSHQIEIRPSILDDYLSYNKTIIINGNEKELIFNLEKRIIDVKMTCDEPRPYLYIDGVWIKDIISAEYQIDRKVFKLKPGSHQITVRHKGHNEIKQTIEVSSDNDSFLISFKKKRIIPISFLQ